MSMIGIHLVEPVELSLIEWEVVPNMYEIHKNGDLRRISVYIDRMSMVNNLNATALEVVN
jgi:hypothetical protein